MNRQYISNSHERYFGFELAYDKAPNIIGGSNNYTGLQYNGNIAGTTWKSAGDEERRRYLFTYDAANRLKTANFTQYTGSSFNQTAGLDFTVNNLQYDANGNITRMNQYGWKGGAGSVMIDELRYNYLPNSNKLRNVYDFQQDPHSKLGDFKYSVNYIQNKSHNLTQDYWFDANGNMVTDRNKEIGNSVQPGIVYNHLNLPEQITVYNGVGILKGNIYYTYDAAGNKLKKRVVEVSQPEKTTLYLGAAIYENDELQFIAHPEGRTRFIKAEGSNPAKFEDDYFIKDHLGNVRMVLTEEEKIDGYPELSFEGTAGQPEVQLQDGYWEDKTGASINVAAVRTARPGGFGTSGTNGSYVSSIKKSQGAIGAAKLLKVMAGDRIHTSIDYYYTAANTISCFYILFQYLEQVV